MDETNGKPKPIVIQENCDHEIGRELKASELVRDTVVVLLRGRIAMSVWVGLILDEFITFHLSSMGSHLILFRPEADRDLLTDDTGNPVRAFEFLGNWGKP